MKTIQKLLLLSVLVFSTIMSYSQGVTTSSLKGKVVDVSGKPLDGVTIALIHVPSGTQYGTMSRADGGYDLQGVRVGGPYTVVATSVGFAKQEKSDVYLNLNETLNIDFALSQTDQQLEEVTVSYDKTDLLNSERTGAETYVNSKELNSMPTISRGQKDFTRLTPQSDGYSFGGRNNLYNNFSLDGSIFNNSFGLDYATPGGQADAQPVSLDAIEQIQVSIAPFDVREGGFTGAGINAVTKSGTNTVKASAYYYFRNEKMIGKKVNELEVPNLDFNTSLSGITVGGPIIKNKLFFFLNAEAERRDELAHGFVADNSTNSGDNVTSVNEDDIKAVKQHLLDEWGYDAGEYQGYNHETFNNKFLVKLDWNISSKHKFSIRYNMLDAWKDILPHPEAIIGRGPTSYRLPFENSSYTINNKISSIVSELNSRFSNNLANKLLVGYTAFRDNREPHSKPFPVIDIFDANGNLAITAGSEMFSTNNILDQDVFQFTDNLTYYADKHTITGGVNVEIFKFNNSFNLFYYPWHMYFGGVDQFLATTSADVDFNAEVTESKKKPFAMSEVDVAQVGFYAQDEFKASDNLNLTFGLRIDFPVYLNKIAESSDIQNFTGWKNENGESVSIDPSVWPNSNVMWAPRFGFNWDAKGDNTLKVRGGSGIFTGRIPFVWLGNQSTNSQMVEQSGGYTFQINSTAEGFKFPQAWKNNLAVDYKFGNGWLATFEGIYTKDINAVVHRNYDMLKPSSSLTGTGDTRAVFGGFNETHIYATSGNQTFLDAGVIVMDNVKEGYQYTLTAQLKKEFSFCLSMSAAYTYLKSTDYTSIPAEIAADAFQRNPVIGDPNQPILSYSRYGMKHRVIATLAYQVAYKNMATSIAAFFEAGQGGRYSYLYSGNVNQDGIATNNDLLYVPANQSDIHFGTVSDGVGVTAANAAEQWTALNAFIEQDPYLSTRRGDYAERHGAMLPWFAQMDVKLVHDFNFMVKESKNTLRLSLDILNFGNMISSKWGVRKLVATTAPITFNGLDSNNVPYFSFNTNLKETYIDNVSVYSKWQMQLGIRYIFN